MSGAPLDRARVAELIVTRAGERHRGSGYRVRGDAVLTAAHVVDGATSVRLRFEPDLPGEWTVDATSWWADPVSDVAVVLVEPRAGDAVAPAGFGRIDDRAAVLAVEAVGFPWWKMRTDAAGKRYRDSCHAVGTVAVLSNWREGTLEVVVPPATERDGDLSPWEGMSGAALWANGHVVGVIAKHHPGDGLGRLAAVRLDLTLDRVDPAHGTPLRDVLAVPAPMPGVLPPQRPALITNAYQALVAEAAPQQLHDRNWELGELVKFCAGDEPYLWWQAGPWAGKSALLAWFAQHPPGGVDVVSFFVTGRWAGQSDSDAFTEALIEQLAALVGEAPELALEARARRGHTLRLLNTAAAACAESGRILLLVVDGLDEDTSRDDGLGRPSIASLLPRRLPPAVRVVVASRPHPQLPDDVAGDHPLRTVKPRVLSVSPYARNIEGEAKRELSTLLAKPGLQRDVLGLITASGGGLTQSDLEELTGQPRYELEALFGGILGRSVGARAARDQGEQVYLFTHDTLREQAERAYGKGLAGYRAMLHTWAEDHRARGWAEDAPEYLLRGYPRLLAASGDVGRMVVLALDRLRHDRMLARTGADGLALTEIVAAAGLVAQARVPDLATLLRLASARSDLGRRNEHIPASLPGVWASLGELDRALALANSIVADDDRSSALAGIVAALVARGEHDRVARVASDAERTASQIPNLRSRSDALCALAEALAGGEEEERVQRIMLEVEAGLHQFGDSYAHDDMVGRLVVLAVGREDHETALRCLEAFADDYRQSLQAEGLPMTVLRASGDDALALRYTTAIRDGDRRNQELWALAQETQEEVERALRILAAVEDVDDEGDEPGTGTLLWDRHCRELAAAAVTAGDDERALAYALAVGDSDDAMGELFGLLADSGELSRAAWFADRFTTSDRTAQAGSWLALAHAHAGDTAEALRLAAGAKALLPMIEDPNEHACSLERLAVAARLLGKQDREIALQRAADELVSRVDNPLIRADVLGAMARIAVHGSVERYDCLADQAETIADQVGPDERVDLLCRLADCAAEAEDGARARRFVEAASGSLNVNASGIDIWRRLNLARIALAIDAMDLVLLSLEPAPVVAELCSLLRIALESGEDARARRIVELTLEGRPYYLSADDQVDSLVKLEADDLVIALANRIDNWLAGNRLIGLAVRGAAEAGDDDRALRFVAALSTSHHRDDSCEAIAGLLASEGHFDRADRYLGVIEVGYRLDETLVSVAHTAWRHGDHARARIFLDRVSSSYRRAGAVAAFAAAVVAAGDAGHARALCLEAEDIARTGAGNASIRVRVDLATALAVAGDHDRADRLASTVEDPDVRVQVFGALVGSALEAGDVSRSRVLAEELAGVVREPATWRFQEVVDALLSSGAAEAADRTVAQLEPVAARCTDQFDRPRWYSVLAQALAVAGRHQEAVELVDEIDHAAEEALALRTLARTTPSGALRDRVRGAITERADELRGTDRAVYWLGDTATALVEFGDFDRVLGLVRAGFDSSDQEDALRALLEGAPDEPALRRELLARCEAATLEITDVYYRDRVFEKFVEVSDEHGDHDEAVRLAGLITETATREDALRDIRLRAIAAGRETAGARKYVAEVLATKDWPVALAAVAKMDLEVLQQFADEVLG